MSKYNERFVEKWIVERRDGFKQYYKKNIRSIAFVSVGFFGGTILTRKEIVVEYLLISLIVIALFPIASWFGNEIRYKRAIADEKK